MRPRARVTLRLLARLAVPAVVLGSLATPLACSPDATGGSQEGDRAPGATPTSDDAGAREVEASDAGEPKADANEPSPDAAKPAPPPEDASSTDDASTPPPTVDAGAADTGTTEGATGSSLASLALANVGLGACSTNSAGSVDFESSCTGNDGSPEYWCADFVQWVWEQAGVDTEGLDAAAGSFYTYGQNFGTLHPTASLGDAVVFNYQGGGYADHVAIVTQVNADGTIETVSGDWNGVGATEAAFSSTSLVVWNTPAYAATVGSTPDIMGMTVAGFISPAPAGASPLLGNSVQGTGCYSGTLAKQMDDNACVQSASDSDWYQCDDGTWVARASDPWTCNGEYAL